MICLTWVIGSVNKSYKVSGIIYLAPHNALNSKKLRTCINIHLQPTATNSKSMYFEILKQTKIHLLFGFT